MVGHLWHPHFPHLAEGVEKHCDCIAQSQNLFSLVLGAEQSYRVPPWLGPPWLGAPVLDGSVLLSCFSLMTAITQRRRARLSLRWESVGKIIWWWQNDNGFDAFYMYRVDLIDAMRASAPDHHKRMRAMGLCFS